MHRASVQKSELKRGCPKFTTHKRACWWSFSIIIHKYSEITCMDEYSQSNNFKYFNMPTNHDKVNSQYQNKNVANINVVWQLFQSLLHLQQTRHVCPKLIFNNEKALTLKTKKKKEKFNSFDISLSKPTEIIPRRLYVPSQETSTSLSAWALDSLLPRFQNGTKKGKRWKEPSAY